MKSMTPRQRWLAVLNRQRPDRLPTDYWATSELDDRLKADLGCADDESLWGKLGIDHMRGAGPRCTLAHHPHDPKANIWGIRYRNVNYGTGSYNEAAHHPLAKATTLEEVHAYRWPTPDDYDYAPVGEALATDDSYRAIKAGAYEPFLLYCALRGMEQAFEDMAVNQEILQGILGHVFDFYYEHNRRIFEAGAGKIDVTYVAEDLGGQTGPLFSLDYYRRFLVPNQKKMADLARSFGVHVFYHTDGSARCFLNDLVETVGIDVLNPIQWRCPGMEIDGLVRDWGDRIAFHGAIDNQQTIPFGTPQDVAAEVRNCADLFRGRRWICAPCHNMQAVTPTANVVALYETARDISDGGTWV